MSTNNDTAVRPELLVDISRLISLIMSITNSELSDSHRQSSPKQRWLDRGSEERKETHE